MTVAQAARDRYSSDEYVANYLYAEWGDVLLPDLHPKIAEDTQLNHAPDTVTRLRALAEPGRFYKEAAATVVDWCATGGVEVHRACDIGGSTGRLAFELRKRLSTLDEIVLAEQSEVFAQWASRFLCGAPFDGWLPVPDEPGNPDYRLVGDDIRQRFEALPGVHIYALAGESTPRPRGYFDLVTCLNVVDRSPQPRDLISRVADLLAPEGLLVVGTPFDFRDKFTPRADWFTDVSRVLPAGWSVFKRAELAYVFKYHRCRFPAYVCDVVGARRSAPLTD